ncbi:hypothetical protein PLICRDRAFT_687915 [Plicaturopsis crispa FD-325 SS-3]|nr:hypothetical protein PLICRDRAFT_687915 [Plicaturopsis crispa FD-325 SS-3]
MATIASSTFLKHLKSIYPTREQTGTLRILHNPWFIAVVVAYSASNCAEGIPRVFEHVLGELKQSHIEAKVPPAQAHSETLLLARKFRESIFKAGLVSGYPRAINGLIALDSVMPAEFRDTKILRDTKTSTEEFERQGEVAFRELYGETADSVQGLLDQIHPDMGWFSNTIGYGLTYGYTAVTSAFETSITLVAALIAVDAPRQINWHTNNMRRLGASLEEANAVRTIAMEVATQAGITWKDGVPEIQ